MAATSASLSLSFSLYHILQLSTTTLFILFALSTYLLVPSSEALPHALHHDPPNPSPPQLQSRTHISSHTCFAPQRDLIAVTLKRVSLWSHWAAKVAAGQRIDVLDKEREWFFDTAFGTGTKAPSPPAGGQNRVNAAGSGSGDGNDASTRAYVRRRFWFLNWEAERSMRGRLLGSPHGEGGDAWNGRNGGGEGGRAVIQCDNFGEVCRGGEGQISVVEEKENQIVLCSNWFNLPVQPKDIRSMSHDSDKTTTLISDLLSLSTIQKGQDPLVLDNRYGRLRNVKNYYQFAAAVALLPQQVEGEMDLGINDFGSEISSVGLKNVVTTAG